MLKNLLAYIVFLKERISEQGSFTRNIAITFSGNVLTQVVGFLFTPIIARVYGPGVYGLFALFIAIVSNLATISTLQLPTGYVAAKSETEFHSLIKITFFALVFFTGFVGVVLWIWGEQLVFFFHVQELLIYLPWVPVYIFLMGVDNILLGWNIRLKQFKRGAFSKIFSTISSKGFTVMFGMLYKPTVAGIIFGNLLSYVFEGGGKLSNQVRKEIALLKKKTTWATLRATISAYRGYPLFLTPGVLIVNISNLLPVFYFSIVFDESTVGFYALASSTVAMPLALVVNSFITVFLQKAAETLSRSRDELREIVFTLYKKLFALGILPLACFAFLSRVVFIILFGAEWESAGVFASFLCIAATFHIVYGPISVLFRLMEKERIHLLINTIFFAVKFLGLWLGVMMGDIKMAIMGFALASLLSSVVSVLVIFQFLQIPVVRVLRDFAIVVFLGAFVVWLS